MKTILRGIILILLAGNVSAQQPAQPFSYDPAAPLDVRETRVESLPGATVHDVSYGSPKGGRVPAYLVVPRGEGPFAGIIFVHWGQGDRSEFLSEALGYARSGAVSLLIDAPDNRPDFPGSGFVATPTREYETYVQLVVDARRGVDLLRSRPDVDSSRIGYVGHSLGATWGGALAGVEKRIKAYVLMGGLPTVTDFSGDDALSAYVMKRYSAEQRERFADSLRPIDPERFVGSATPARVYFQFARWDAYISRAFAERFVRAASSPREARWYPTSHEFNDPDALRDRSGWLAQALGLSAE